MSRFLNKVVGVFLFKETEFWAAFLAAIELYFPEQLNAEQRTPSTPQSEVAKEYDFIIAGGGSAGCVLANRLTENPDWSVLLIEAGSVDDYISDTPFLTEFLVGTTRDWNYTTAQQEKACLSSNGICKTRKGRFIGGSSSINWMMYTRGTRADYDGWLSLGNQGWGYEDVLPYFIKAENMTEPCLANSSYHGTKGPLNVQYPKYITPMRKEYIKAGEELGWKFGDYNGEEQRNVIDYLQYTINGPLRESTAKAYLNPIIERQNLDIILNSVVSKIIIENKIAKGVEYYRDGKFYEVFSTKDVIISTGAIETPKLLMLSGIGPEEHLRDHNIEVIVDLPVGKQYQDHVNVGMYFELNDKAETLTERDWKTNESVIAYAKDREGPLTMAAGGTEAVSFFNPLQVDEPPTVQIVYSSAAAANNVGNRHIMRAWSFNVYPQSVGNLKLKSKDFKDQPLINPNIFKKEIDKTILIKGMEKILEFMQTKQISKYAPKQYTSDIVHPKCRGKEGKDYIHCAVTFYTDLTDRPFGTARMGPCENQDTVVCSELLFVKGVQRLRVVDASIMPMNPRANTNAPVIMVAEKASDIIKDYHQNREDCPDGDGDNFEITVQGNENEGSTINNGPEHQQQGQPGGSKPSQKPNIISYFINSLQHLVKPYKPD